MVKDGRAVLSVCAVQGLRGASEWSSLEENKKV